jgi:uncharacterized RDD family membrane protein YckC
VVSGRRAGQGHPAEWGTALAGLGWQELVIVGVIVGVLVAACTPFYAVAWVIRYRLHERGRGIDRARETAFNAGPPMIRSDAYAGFWHRFGAAVIDGAIVLVPSAIVFELVARSRPGVGGKFAGELLNWLVALVYAVVGNGLGATLGKRFAGLAVIDAAGDVAGMRRAVIRAVLPFGLRLLSTIPMLEFRPPRLLDGVPPPAWVFPTFLVLGLLLAIDILWMVRDPRKQTLHDKMAGTFVIRT